MISKKLQVFPEYITYFFLIHFCDIIILFCDIFIAKVLSYIIFFLLGCIKFSRLEKHSTTNILSGKVFKKN